MSAKTKRQPQQPRITFPTHQEPTHAEIAVGAWAIWQADGQPQDRDVEHWLQAEAHLRLACKADAKAATSGQPQTDTLAPRSNA